MVAKIFVYGSLRRGFDTALERLLGNGVLYVDNGFVYGELYDSGLYPALVLSRADGRKIVGEIYQLVDVVAALSVLDDYECCSQNYCEPHEYRRELATVCTTVASHQCWIYVYNLEIKSDFNNIFCGDYKQYKA